MNNFKEKKHSIAILGAGCAGLAAGWALAKKGYSVVLFEEANCVGGLAGCIKYNDNIYEYGPHIFHTTDNDILNDIKSLMGDELNKIDLTILINFFGNYYKFPLSFKDVFFKLPRNTVIKAVLSFIWNFLFRFFRKPPIENSETILKRNYGDVLYKLFFKSYIHRVWGINPAEFSPAFARERIPRLNIINILNKPAVFFKTRLKHKITTDNYVEKVAGDHYTTKQGFALIAQKISDKIVASGGKVLVNSKVTKIHKEGNKIKFIEFSQNGASHKMEFDGVISTIPINDAIKMIEPICNSKLLQSAGAIKFRRLVFVGLLMKRVCVLPSALMYFREHSFNRISDFSKLGHDIRPKGHTILVAEISCDIKDEAWNNDEFAKKSVIADLVKEKIITPDEVVEAYVYRYKHAYPVYLLNYEHHRDTLLNFINATDNMETAGRQGRFQYVNAHVAMRMGIDAADRLIKKILNS